MVKLEVEDNGMGILPDEEPLLFKVRIDSKKQLHNPKWYSKLKGGHGEFLHVLDIRLTPRGARLGFKNKGEKMGAVFFYEIPTNVLIEHGSPSSSNY